MKSRTILFFLGIYSMLIIGCTDKPVTDSTLIGLTESEIVKLKGSPNSENTFIVSDEKLLEYRYNLINIFPNYKESNIEIKEMQWMGESKTSIIWFKQENESWIVIDNISFGKNVRL